MTKTSDSGAHIAGLMNIDKTALPADGGEQFNRLIFARSPYLLQHAENPVEWYEWGDDAFEKARRENRPILLSIGYATCHWCHVMAHECFEDDEVADLLNRHFVCIKVDREERPDIDDFFMTVSQVLTGSGGWPLNIFMTPDKRPFFAMTYLPKHGRNGMSGLMELLANIATLWRQQPDRIEKNCRGIMEALSLLSLSASQECIELEEIGQSAFEQLEQTYDSEYCGFGTAPKFPMPINISWLIEQGDAGNQQALKMALDTLRSIRTGGIWDQVGGGLHRYAVDRKWLVPHFEKMLYDQAMVALTALEAFQASGEEVFLEMTENIFRFVKRELTSESGGFHSALDADSEGIEGKFYLWDKVEVDTCLGKDAELFCSYFDISADGNFEGHSILNIPLSLDEFCKLEGLERNSTDQKLERCRERLLERRSRRIRPLRDEKIITAWNGLMIAALAKGGLIGGKQEHIDSAARAAAFILSNLRRTDGRLLRSYLNGPSDTPAFLEDYASLCLGLIELFEATLDVSWLEQALQLTDDMTRLFYDPRTQTFAKTGRDTEQMPLAASLEHDGVLPSPFSLAAKCFIRLGNAAERPELHDLAHALLAPQLADSGKHPTAHLGALQAGVMLENEAVVIQLEGRRDSSRVRELLRAAKTVLLPGLTIRFQANDHSGQAQLCAQGTCFPPVSSGDELTKLLALLK